MYSKARLFALVGFIGLSVTSFAQRPEVTSAAIAVDRNDLDAAKQHIDEAKAIVDEKGPSAVSESTLQKYYYRRSEIYYKLYAASKDLTSLNEALENATALLAYNKAVDDDDYTEEIMELLPTMFVDLSNTAAAFSGDPAKLADAYNLYNDMYKFKATEGIGEVDTTSLYYMALLASQMKDTALTIQHYKQLLEMGYHGRQWTAMYEGNRVPVENKEVLDAYLERGVVSDPELSPSINEELWIQTIFWLNIADRKEEFNEYLAKAMALYPDNSDLVIFQLQDYLDSEDYDGALANLDKLRQADPGEALYLYNMGFIYHVYKEDRDKGLEFYNMAIEADSTHKDALYQAGLVYVEYSNVKADAMNDVPSNKQREYDALKKEKEDLLKKALEYFLLAEAQDPEDKTTLQSLAKVYYQLGNAEKALEYNEKAQ